jgi:hypothetical protein
MTTATETKTPSALEAQDALNTCKQCLGVLYCALEAGMAAEEDRFSALDFAVGQLHRNLQTVRDHFGMDEKEAASC